MQAINIHDVAYVLAVIAIVITPRAIATYLDIRENSRVEREND